MAKPTSKLIWWFDRCMIKKVYSNVQPEQKFTANAYIHHEMIHYLVIKILWQGSWLTPWNPKTNCHVSQFLLGSFKILCRQNLSKNRDLIWAVNEAHVQASTLASSVLKVRGKKDEAYYTACWTLRLNRVCTIVNKSEISANKQRNSAHQRDRANAAAKIEEHHFRINIYIILVDHITKHLHDRFPDDIF